MSKLIIASILKAQGIKGEVKVKPILDDNKQMLDIKDVYIDNQPYKVLGARLSGEFAYLSLRGIADRNAAELLRGKLLEIDRSSAPPLSSGRYYIVDVIGCEIITDSGEVLGKVDGITSGRVDIYSASVGGKKYMFPLVKNLLINIDIAKKIMTVNKSRLDEVILYED